VLEGPAGEGITDRYELSLAIAPAAGTVVAIDITMATRA
jgi:hypothetical protein